MARLTGPQPGQTNQVLRAQVSMHSRIGILVHASNHNSKSFGWTILQEDNDHVPIMQSLVTFRSMADAHVAGTVALGKFKTHQALSAKRQHRVRL
jgi:hypothetical protein